MGNYRGPRRPVGEEKRNHPDLFVWAETLAARLGATREDVAKLALAATPFVLFGLLSSWLASDEDSVRRPVLAYATVGSFAATCVAWITRGCQSRIRVVGLAIFLYGATLVASCGVVAFVIYQNWNFDAAHFAQKREDAAKASAKALAKEKEARAAEMRRAEKAQREIEAANQAEAECRRDRDEAMERAKQNQRSARRFLENCQSEYAKQLIPFKSEADECKLAQDQFDKTKSQVWVANAKICETSSITKSR